VNINYLLKQPIFRTAEEYLKTFQRPINVRFESGKSLKNVFVQTQTIRISSRYYCTTNASTFSNKFFNI